MNILGKYLRKESLKSFIGILLVLFLFSLGQLFVESLRAVSRGVLPSSMLYVELSLRSLNSLKLLIPLSLYLAILSKLSAMYRNQEMVVFHSCGVSIKNIFSMFIPIIVFFSLFLALISLVALPNLFNTSKQLISKTSKDVTLLGLNEGIFQEIYGSKAVIFINKINVAENRLENIIIHSENENGLDIISAKFGYQYEDSVTKERYISLFDGFRNEISFNSKKSIHIKFKRNDIKLPRLEGKSANVSEEGKPIFELLESNKPIDKAEIHNRLSPAIATIVLILLAVSISKVSPRGGKYGKLFLGLLIYISYLNLQAIAVSLIAQGSVPMWIGSWWVHILYAIYGIRMIYKADSTIDKT